MSVGVAWFPDYGHIVADIFYLHFGLFGNLSTHYIIFNKPLSLSLSLTLSFGKNKWPFDAFASDFENS